MGQKGDSEYLGTPKLVRVAFIGMGYWGPNLLRNFSEADACEVVGVSDLKPGRLAFVQKRYPHLKLTLNYGEFLQDASVDAVCVVTPVSTHHAIVKDALLAGKHVLVAKPMADSVAKATEIVRLAEERRKQVLVDHTFVFSGAVNQIRGLVCSGELGRLCYVDMARMNLGPPASEVDVVWDLMPHDLSILLHWLGETPSEVSARGWRFVRRDLCDVAYARLEFASGVFVNLHASWLSPQKARRAYLLADRKMVCYDDVDPAAKVRIYDEGFDTRIGASDQAVVDFEYGRGDIRIPALEEGEPLRKECTHFVRSLIDGTPVVSDARMGLQVVQVLEAISASMEHGGEAVRLEAESKVAPQP